jgi:hypothetical protein
MIQELHSCNEAAKEAGEQDKEDKEPDVEIRTMRVLRRATTSAQ